MVLSLVLSRTEEMPRLPCPAVLLWCGRQTALLAALNFQPAGRGRGRIWSATPGLLVANLPSFVGACRSLPGWAVS